LAWGEGVPGPHPHAQFHRCAFKILYITALKIAKIGIFGYKFVKKGIPIMRFLKKIGLGKGVPGLHTHAKFHWCGFKNGNF